MNRYMLKNLNNENDIKKLIRSLEIGNNKTKVYKGSYFILSGFIDIKGIHLEGYGELNCFALDNPDDGRKNCSFDIFKEVKKQYMAKKHLEIKVDDAKETIYIRYPNGLFESLYDFKNYTEIDRDTLKKMIDDIAA